MFGDGGAEALAVGDARGSALHGGLAAEIFPLGDIDHFRRDDAGAGEFILGERGALRAVPAGVLAHRAGRGGAVHRRGLDAGAQRLVAHGEFAGEVFAGRPAIVERRQGAALIGLDLAVGVPVQTVARQAVLDVQRVIGIGIGTGRVVDAHRRLIGRGMQIDLAMRHFQRRRRRRRRIDPARPRQRW